MTNQKCCQVGSKYAFFYLILAILLVTIFSGCHWINDKEGDQNNSNNQPSAVVQDAVSDDELAVQLYFYNYLEDKAIDQAVPCSPDAVKPVERRIAKTDDYIKGTLNLLLKGGITEEEKSYGFMTEFPNDGVEISELNLDENGVLSIKFADRDGFLSGGSCRVGLLYSQIEKTALQFIEVNSVTIIPEELFEP